MEKFVNLHLDGDSGTPKFRQLANAVNNAIAEGRMQTGDALPSVSSICVKYDLSRDTVFKAYSILREQGVVVSQPGKGYFIADHILKVFVFLDTFKAYKEVLYDSFFHSLPSNVIADVNFHHYNSHVFKRLIEDSVGRYSKFIVMPFISPEVDAALSLIPKNKLLIIDWNVYADRANSVIYQDFGNALYVGLSTVIDRLRRYKELHFLYPAYTNHPHDSVDAFLRFCNINGFSSVVETDPDDFNVTRGVAYVSVSDRMLGRFLQQCRDKNLALGSDVGMISYNETPMKPFIENGITVFSTDFNKMGQLAAKFVTDDKDMNVCVPSKIIVRSSL